jgi:hypothetical protein
VSRGGEGENGRAVALGTADRVGVVSSLLEYVLTPDVRRDDLPSRDGIATIYR